jgi:hypothetical protein
MTDQEIVEYLNRQGSKTNKGNKFTLHSIKWIRYKYKIPSANLQREGELTIKQIMEKFSVSYYVVQYWIERGIIKAEHRGNKLWIVLTQEDELKLQQWVDNSTKIAKARTQT